MNRTIFKKTFLVASVLGSLSAIANTTTTIRTKTVNTDNSGINKRDLNKGKYGPDTSQLTAQDQASGSKADVELTRKIRSHLVDDESLSTYAKNVKIITLNGIVTLRGPVSNETEKTAVAHHAAMLVNKSNIRNELDIAPSDQSTR